MTVVQPQTCVLHTCTEEAAAWVTAIRSALAAARQAAADGVSTNDSSNNTIDNECAVLNLYKHKLASDRPISSNSTSNKSTITSSSTQQQQKGFEIELIPQSARWGEPIDVGTVKDGESLICELLTGGTVNITRADLEACAIQIAVVYAKSSTTNSTVTSAVLPTHVQLTSAYSTPLQHRRMANETATTGSSASGVAVKSSNGSNAVSSGSAYMVPVSVAVCAAACAVALVTEQMTVPTAVNSVVSATTAAVALAAVCAVALIKALKHSCAIKKQASIAAKAAAAVKTAANSPKRTVNGTVSSNGNSNGRPALGGRRISNSLSQFSEWVITLQIQTCDSTTTTTLSGKRTFALFSQSFEYVQCVRFVWNSVVCSSPYGCNDSVYVCSILTLCYALHVRLCCVMHCLM
jgi:hypothetical protein